MQTTTNIGLKTYEANDPTDWLGEFNYNMNKIDTAVGSQNDQIDLIEETAGTAVTTANTASATATEALETAETKTSINDNVASATTTYSSNKINTLIEGIEPGTEIDDTVTSTTKTWSSSKINTEVSSKTSINDTTASSTTTYSSNKINSLISVVGSDFPDYENRSEVVSTSTLSGLSSDELNAGYTVTEDCYIYCRIQAKSTTSSYISCTIGNIFAYINDASKNLFNQTPIFKVKANTNIGCTFTSVDTSSTVHTLTIYKIPIIN